MKHMKWFALLMVLALVISACAAPAAAPGAAPAGEEASEAAAPAAGGGEFHIAWPYDVAPKGHNNTFVTGGYLAGGPYQSLLEPPLFYYMWADASWMPVAGESWEWADYVTLRVKLPDGAV